MSVSTSKQWVTSFFRTTTAERCDRPRSHSLRLDIEHEQGLVKDFGDLEVGMIGAIELLSSYRFSPAIAYRYPQPTQAVNTNNIKS